MPYVAGPLRLSPALDKPLCRQRVDRGGHGGPWPLTVCGNDNRNDEAVDAQHTRHDHGHDGLHDQLRPHDAHGSDAHARLGGSIGGTHAWRAREAGAWAREDATCCPGWRRAPGAAAAAYTRSDHALGPLDPGFGSQGHPRPRREPSTNPPALTAEHQRAGGTDETKERGRVLARLRHGCWRGLALREGCAGEG
jgi:hypothetical protein